MKYYILHVLKRKKNWIIYLFPGGGGGGAYKTSLTQQLCIAVHVSNQDR